MTTSAAPSASMSAFIASHHVRREWGAEFIIAAQIFSRAANAAGEERVRIEITKGAGHLRALRHRRLARNNRCGPIRSPRPYRLRSRHAFGDQVGKPAQRICGRKFSWKTSVTGYRPG